MPDLRASDADREDCDLLDSVAPSLARHGYHLVEHERRPVWTTLELLEDRSGTRITAGGIAPLTVRRAFARMES